MTGRLLVHVEDPGAVNFAAPILEPLEITGIETVVIADGFARNALIPNGSVSFSGPVDDPASFLAGQGISALLVGTGENRQSLAHQLVDAAHTLHLPSAALIDSAANAAYRFSGLCDQSPLRHAPDRLLVADEATADAFRSLGHPADAIDVVGHPHFDVIRRKSDRLRTRDRSALRQRLLPGYIAGRTVITFLAEINDGLDPDGYARTEDYTLIGRGKRDDRTGIVMEEVLDACRSLSPKPFMVLRPHPKNKIEDFTGLDAEFDVTAEAAPIDELLYVSDLVIGMTATPLTEAALMGVPVLSVLPRIAEAQWLAITALGLAPTAVTRQELPLSIKEGLAGTNQADAKTIARAFPSGAIDKAVKVVRSMIEGGTPMTLP